MRKHIHGRRGGSWWVGGVCGGGFKVKVQAELRYYHGEVVRHLQEHSLHAQELKATTVGNYWIAMHTNNCAFHS